MHSGDGGNFTTCAIEIKKVCSLDDGRSTFLPVTSGKVNPPILVTLSLQRPWGREGAWREKQEGAISSASLLYSEWFSFRLDGSISPPLLSCIHPSLISQKLPSSSS